jgi:hypothetical protein
MFSLSRRFCAVALVLATAALAPASARACDRWGAVVIQNRSEVTIPFQMRLGTDGAWIDYTVPARTKHAIYFRLDESGRVATPHIRFDNSQGAIKTYSLGFYEVDLANTQKGKPFKFEYQTNTGWDLYTAD